MGMLCIFVFNLFETLFPRCAIKIRKARQAFGKKYVC